AGARCRTTSNPLAFAGRTAVASAPQGAGAQREGSMRRIAAVGLSFAVALALVQAALAQGSADDYPQRNVTFICPFPAGGGTDILTRLLAHELQDKLKRTVIVENRPGAGTIVAAQAAARAAPDGHTIFLAPSTTLAMGPSLYKSLPYDTRKDFAPIGLVG